VNAVNTLDPERLYRITPMRDLLGLVTWTVPGVFDDPPPLLGVVGLLPAFSGTYAVRGLSRGSANARVRHSHGAGRDCPSKSCRQ
jgi:hypothetical protein